MNTTTQVSLGIAKSLAALTNQNLQPHGATASDIPEKPGVLAPKPPPLLQDEEDHPTTNVTDIDEKYCLTGYGDLSVSENSDVVETGIGDQRLRDPQLKHIHPYTGHQTAKAVSEPVSKFYSDDTNELLLTSDIRQLEPESLRNAIKTTSTTFPSIHRKYNRFYEGFIKKNSPVRMRQRSPIPSTTPASEAVDARASSD